MMFDKKKYIERMQKPVEKLVAYFQSKGISFDPDDGLDNVTFVGKGKEVKLSKHSFYRFSGIAVLYKDKEGRENQIETVPVTDEMFMEMFMKPIIEIRFKD